MATYTAPLKGPGNTGLALIETVGGNTIYNGNDPILTRLGETANHRPIYTLQKAGTIKAGQHVSFDKQHIELSLDEIAKALSTMPAYAYAQADVFLTNQEGKLVPRFKHNLIKGLWQKAKAPGIESRELPFLAGMSEDELEAKILGNRGADFLPQEYGKMGEIVHKRLSRYVADGLRKEDGSPIVVQETTTTWVKGETDGPLERNVFYALAEINPEFEKWFQTMPGQESPWESYKLWVKVRQGLRRDFETMKAKGTLLLTSPDDDAAEGSAKESGKYTSLTPFKEHVLKEVYRDVSTQHADLIVTRVVPLPQARLEETVARAEAEGKRKPLLYKGLCKEKPEDLKDSTVVQYSSIVDLLGILSEALAFAIYRYLGRPEVTAKVAEIAKSAGLEVITEGAKGRALMIHEPGDKNMLKRGISGTYTDLPKEISDRFTDVYYAQQGSRRYAVWEGTMTAIKAISGMIHGDALKSDGALDKYLGMEQGTVAALISMAANCNVALPELYFDMMKIGTQVYDLTNLAAMPSGKNRIREIERQITEKGKEFYSIAGRLESEFGIRRRKGLLLDFLTKSMMSVDTVARFTIETGSSSYQIVHNQEVMANAKATALQSGMKPSDFMTRDEAVKLLSSVGLPQLIKLIPNNDFFDQVVAPLPPLGFPR